MRAAQFRYFDAPTPLALAHRGGSLLGANIGRENTTAAFQAAYDLGYRYFETDVHATSDGVVLAFHDTHLDRVTDHRGAIADQSWAQIKDARVADQPIPTLAELFETFPDVRFNIDIKAPAAVVPTAQVILQHGALHRVCIGSFSQRRLNHVRSLLGDGLATAAGGPGIASMRFMPSMVTAWLATPSPVLQVPETYVVAGRSIDVVTAGLVEVVHRRGKMIHVWTVDEADRINALLDLGVDGLVSDRIDTLKDVLVERGQWVVPAAP